MSKKTKNKKFRANVKEFNDADYLSDLPKAEREYYEQFALEYYNNELNQEGSIHRKALSPAKFEKAKKETFDATHAQNRDLFGISNTAYLVTSFEEDFIEVDLKENKKEIRYRMKTENPAIILDTIIEEALDDLNIEELKSEKKFILKNLVKQSVALVQVVRTEKKSGRIKF